MKWRPPMNTNQCEEVKRLCRDENAIDSGRRIVGRRGYVLGVLVATIVVAQPAGLSLKAFGDEPARRYTISKETTYLTEPLRADGAVDYIAALNQRCSKGVTPENNAAVLLWKAVGPEEIDPEDRDKFYRMLGIPPLPEKGDYFVEFGSYLAGQKKDANPPDAKPGAAEEDTWDFLHARMKQPWSRKEFPVLAQWLAANEKPLALVVEASKRPRFYDPLCAGETTPLIAVPMPVTMKSRRLVEALCIRAMLRLGEGRVEDAWLDLLACHRLARLIGQGPTAVHAQVALPFELWGCEGDLAVLEHADLAARRLAKMRRDLDRLPAMSKMVDKLDAAERFTYLDCVAVFSREGLASIAVFAKLVESEALKTSIESLSRHNADTPVDWDLVLREGNSWYERMADAWQRPTRDEQRKALSKVAEDLAKIRKAAEDVKSSDAAMHANPRKALSERLSQVMLTVFLTSPERYVQAEDRWTMRLELDKLAFALAAYRVDQGTYPAALAELAPKYVAEVPNDVCTGGELHYRLEGKGYLLYSVGPNGKDDGAKGLDDRETTKNGDEDWDDIVVRMPGPERK